MRHGERRLAWGKEEGLVPLGQEVEYLGLGDMELWGGMLIVMLPILINKDVFVSSYNDLKFMVRNHNYVCINLIKCMSRTA